jgi:hypothetical protein
MATRPSGRDGVERAINLLVMIPLVLIGALIGSRTIGGALGGGLGGAVGGALSAVISVGVIALFRALVPPQVQDNELLESKPKTKNSRPLQPLDEV